MTEIVVEKGDLTLAHVDAIVNAASSALLGGGGVDGAIHAAAGPELLEACRVIEQVTPGVRCPTGEARITDGFKLPARHVIHTVGPIYRVPGPGESAETSESSALLRAAYTNSLALARDHSLRTIAFPAISCGVYGYPLKEAAKIAVQAAREQGAELDEIRFVLFSDDVLGDRQAAMCA